MESDCAASSDHADPFQVRRRFWMTVPVIYEPTPMQKAADAQEMPEIWLSWVAAVDSDAESSSDHADPFQVRRRFWMTVPTECRPAATQKVVDTQVMPEIWLAWVAEVDSDAESSSDHADPFQVRRRFWDVPIAFV